MHFASGELIVLTVITLVGIWGRYIYNIIVPKMLIVLFASSIHAHANDCISMHEYMYLCTSRNDTVVRDYGHTNTLQVGSALFIAISW